MKKKLFLFAFLTIGCGSSSNPSTPNSASDGGIASIADAASLSASDGALGPACQAVTPCGGNILGSWQVTHACLPNAQQLLASELGPQYADCYIDMRYGFFGQISYEHDGTFLWQGNSDGVNAYLAMEERCYEALNRKTCAQSAPRCQLDNGICSCAMGERVDAGANGRVSSGRFIVNNERLLQKTTAADDLAAFSSNVLYKNNPQAAGEFGTYCVTGDTLTITFDEVQITATRITPPSATVEALVGSPNPVPAPVRVATTYQSADKSCPSAELVGSWKTIDIAVDDRLQRNLINRVRLLDPDGECAAVIALRDEGSITFGAKTSLFNGPASVREKLSIDVTYAASCLAAKGIGCQDVAANYQKRSFGLDPFETAACATGAEGNCVCSRSQGGEEPDCGYTATTGNDYQLMPNRFSGNSFDVTYAHTQLASYCLMGNQMTIYNQAIIIGGLRGSASVTLQKQN